MCLAAPYEFGIWRTNREIDYFIGTQISTEEKRLELKAKHWDGSKKRCKNSRCPYLSPYLSPKTEESDSDV